MSNTLFDRLFSRAIICENGCWEYSGYRIKDGYGQLRVMGGRKELAHRAAYDLCVGDIPPGMFVLHSCDNPPCVNPAHLFLGTAQDNSDDKIAEQFGVVQSWISMIKHGKAWSHLIPATEGMR